LADVVVNVQDDLDEYNPPSLLLLVLSAGINVNNTTAIMTTPEDLARQNIDAQLAACGWSVQSRAGMNLYEARGVAVREFQTEAGPADYLLFIDQKAAGVIEANGRLRWRPLPSTWKHPLLMTSRAP
jgi:hypothetical protein